MCLIDKVATKQWRQVWTIVSKTTKQVHTKAWDQVYLEANSREKLFAVMPPAEETFRVVFLRDPLERFLSAFLDKCVGVNNRREGYCWPKRVYYNENDSDENDYTRLNNSLHNLSASCHCNGIFILRQWVCLVMGCIAT